MYTQLLPRVLLGGWTEVGLNVNILDRAKVTHVVNMRHEDLPDLAADQFMVFEGRDGELDFRCGPEHWYEVLSWVALVYENGRNILYFHARYGAKTGTPMSCYAGLRAIGYGAIEARRKIENAHPIDHWFEHGIRGIELVYYNWCKAIGKNPELRRQNMLRSLKESAIKLSEVSDARSGAVV